MYLCYERTRDPCTAGASRIVDNYPAENGNSRGGKCLDDGKRKIRYIPASQSIPSYAWHPNRAGSLDRRDREDRGEVRRTGCYVKHSERPS